MAECTYRTRTIVTHEWHIPDGAAIAEFSKAYSAAPQQYESIHGAKPEWDDWARVYGVDDGVCIRFDEVSRG